MMDPAIIDEFDDGAALLEFYETIPTLRDIALNFMAIESWRQFISNEKAEHKAYFDDFGEFRFLETEDKTKVNKILHQLPIPDSFHELLKLRIDDVRTEMNKWAEDYEDGVFELEGTIKISDLMFCHWLPNGTIDHTKSAWNMLLSNPRMTPVNKFEIMCKYCFQDEIKKFPLNSIPEDVIKKVTFNEHPLTFYWLCYLNDEMDKLPNKRDESVDMFMITAWDSYTWSAIEYFWDRIEEDYQASRVKHIIAHRPEYQLKLFFKMNKWQREYALWRSPVAIMENFWKHPGQERFASLAWIYIRNEVDYEQFVKIWDSLRRSSHPWVNIEEKKRYLLDIWNHCPDRLKKIAYRPDIVNIFVKEADDPCRFFRHFPCDDIEFLKAYLSSASAEFRKQIIFERADAFVSIIDLDYTDQVVKLCLPEAADVVKFKKQVLESDFIKESFFHPFSLRNGDLFDVLSDFLDYFCQDSNSRSEYCCEILEKIIEKQESCKWTNVIEFIKVNLSTEPDRALEYIKRIVLSCEGFCWEHLSDEDEMGEMIEVVTQVLNAEELRAFKSEALEELRTGHQWVLFGENMIDRFLLWCCDNDGNSMVEFKEELEIDEIFENVWEFLKSSIDWKIIANHEAFNVVFGAVDRFLFWYYGNTEDVKKFKLEKVFNYRDGGTSMFLMVDEDDEYDDSESDLFTRKVLPWFFENDQVAIESFKKKFQDEDIVHMI